MAASVVRRLRGEDGFTIVEMTVATGVILTALTMLGTVVAGGLTTSGIERQRQSANGLANQTLEQIRSLAFTVLQKGLDDTDLANTAGTSDTNITTSGCGGAYCFGGEQVVHSATTTVDPLVPHQKTVVVGPTTFTISSYVTHYENDVAASAYRVTVYVNYTGLGTGDGKRVQVQTIIYSAASCLSLTVHPFSGPCQPSFSSIAVANSGTVDIAGTVGQIELDHATLSSGRATSDAAIEQLTRVQGISQSSGATLQAVGADETTIGRQTVSSKADSDPDLPGGLYDTQSQATQGAASTVLSVNGDSLTVSTTGGDTGSTTSTTSACTGSCVPASPVRYSPNLTGFTNENDLQPSGGSGARTAAAVTAQADHSGLGTVNLATLGAQVTPSTATFDRTAPVGNDGKVRATVNRSAIDMSAAALPANLLPVFNFALNGGYFVRVTGLTDSVTAEAGKDSAATPTASQTAGTVTYIGPGGTLVTKALSDLLGGLTIPTVVVSGTVSGAPATITLDASVTPPSTATTSSCGGTCDRTSATAMSTPFTISIHYQIAVNGNSVQDATYTVNPGTLIAKATYEIAPT